MKVFIDNNVLIDYLLVRQPFFKSSAIIMDMCRTREIEGIIASLTFTNAAYILRKAFPLDILYEKLEYIMSYCHLSAVDEKIVATAIAERGTDFEDAVQYHSALFANADIVITRDKTGFKNRELPIYTPDEFLTKTLQ